MDSSEKIPLLTHRPLLIPASAFHLRGLFLCSSAQAPPISSLKWAEEAMSFLGEKKRLRAHIVDTLQKKLGFDLIKSGKNNMDAGI